MIVYNDLAKYAISKALVIIGALGDLSLTLLCNAIGTLFADLIREMLKGYSMLTLISVVALIAILLYLFCMKLRQPKSTKSPRAVVEFENDNITVRYQETSAGNTNITIRSKGRKFP